VTAKAPLAAALLLLSTGISTLGCTAEGPLAPADAARSAVSGTVTDTTEFERRTSAPGDPAVLPGGTQPGPDSDSDKPKRGNTPPGLDRAGNPPSAGAILDPAGVTKGPPPR
jgi:hypothetical protein